jgi:hypothetical protein
MKCGAPILSEPATTADNRNFDNATDSGKLAGRVVFFIDFGRLADKLLQGLSGEVSYPFWPGG